MNNTTLKDKRLLISANWNIGPLAKFLLRRDGTNVNARDEKNYTPLMIAVMRGNTSLAEHLILEGADVNASSEDTSTALMWAAQQDLVPIVRLLIERGATTEASNKAGETALMIAVRCDCKGAVLTLLEGGANINHQNNEQVKVWRLANESMKTLLDRYTEDKFFPAEPKFS